MPDIKLYNMEGQEKGSLEVSELIFDAPINEGLVHQALVRQLANMRRGTHSTLTRGEVRGGGRKPWRQKGTGRARHGSIRSPLWRGGGITFGPRPRDYSKKLPKRMRRLALCSVLSDKMKQEKIIALEDIKFEEPKTKKFVAMLKALDLPDNTLVVVKKGDSEQEKNDFHVVAKSASNIKGVKVIASDIINIYDLLKYDRLVMTKDAINRLEEVIV